MVLATSVNLTDRVRLAQNVRVVLVVAGDRVPAEAAHLVAVDGAKS